MPFLGATFLGSVPLSTDLRIYRALVSGAEALVSGAGLRNGDRYSDFQAALFRAVYHHFTSCPAQSALVKAISDIPLPSGEKGLKQCFLKIAIAVTGADQRYLRSVDSGTDPLSALLGGRLRCKGFPKSVIGGRGGVEGGSEGFTLGVSETS